jgi:cytochrome bd ubiquinol oxidase subunit II
MMETFLGIDLPTWWFLVLGALFTGYSILDGFDFGAGAWHLFLHDESHRRIALNAIGPVWDGNEVWLVIGFGAMFAGFPVMYASLLSSMYVPFILFLALIIFRAVSIEFRGKESMKWWLNTWDFMYFFASTALAFLLGVVLGNVTGGIAIGANGEYLGRGMLDFFSLFSILTGITVTFLLMTHGGCYLILKTEGALCEKIMKQLKWSIYLFIFFFIVLTVYTFFKMPHLTDKFRETPLLLLLPAAAFLSIANIPRLENKSDYLGAFIFSAVTMSLMLISVAIEIFPVVLVSSADPSFSLTIYDVASSDKSLGIMLTIVVIGLPLVLAYTFIVYKTFMGKVKLEEHSY